MVIKAVGKVAVTLMDVAAEELGQDVVEGDTLLLEVTNGDGVVDELKELVRDDRPVITVPVEVSDTDCEEDSVFVGPTVTIVPEPWGEVEGEALALHVGW